MACTPRNQCHHCAMLAGLIRGSLVAVTIAFLSAGSPAWPAGVGPEQRDVQTAINNASTGDTVLVCAGTATWTTKRAGSPAVIINKAITLQGATNCTGAGATLSCTDGTIINDGTGTNDGEVIIRLAVSNARLTGFSFHDPRRITDYKAMVDTAVGSINWRIDNCRLSMSAPATRGISGSRLWFDRPHIRCRQYQYCVFN